MSNPPGNVPARLALKVAGSANVVSVYASPTPHIVKGAFRLVKRASLRGHRVSLKVPARLRPGAWFVVVCPATGHGNCAASKKSMLKAPRTLSAPVQATPVPESARATTATIGSTGGTLSATSAEGTRFRLDIPAGSVPDGTQITMTPLSSLGGPAWAGKLIGAVQLAPEGLALAHGGTLTIVPSNRVPVAHQIAVGYNGAGSDLREVPLAPTRTAIEIPLAHFSGAGVGDSPGGGAPSSTGSTILDFYSQLIAEDLRAARDGQMSDQEAFDQAQSWIKDALNDVMRDEVPPGLNDDDAAQQAIRDLLTLARTAALLGDSSESTFNGITPTIVKLLEGVYNRAQQRCASNHDLSQISKILDTDRTEILVTGSENRHTIPEDLKCLKFKLEFTSQISDTGGVSDGTFDMSTTSSPTVSYDAGSGLLVGQAPITYTEASGSKTQSYSCPNPGGNGWTETQTITGSQSSTLQVVKVTFPDLSQITQPNGNLAVQLVIDPGQPQEVIQDDRTPQCGEAPGGTGPGLFWWGDFITTPLASDTPGTGFTEEVFNNDYAGVFTIPLDNFNSDSVHAVFNGTDDSGNSGNQVTEQLTIDLIHTPGS